MAVASLRYHVLYWIKAHVPTAHQIADARQYGPHVSFRNANFHTVGSGMEPCTAVAGFVPSDYARKFPSAVPYMDWLEGKLPAAPLPAGAAKAPPPPGVELSIPMRDRGAPPLPVPPPPAPTEEGNAEAAASQEQPADFGLAPPPSGEQMAPPPPPAPSGGRLSRAQQAAKDKGEGIWEDDGK